MSISSIYDVLSSFASAVITILEFQQIVDVSYCIQQSLDLAVIVRHHITRPQSEK